MNPRVLKMLSQTNLVEVRQKITHRFADEIPPYAIGASQTTPASMQTLSHQIFKDCDVYIRRHNRYADYPKHSHPFIEANYVLQGSATEHVDGKTIKMNTGDILLIDVGTEHEIEELGENDLLINVLFQEDILNMDLLNEIRKSNSVLFEFLIDRALGDQENQQHYLFFKNHGTQKISHVIDRMIEEYYLKEDFYRTIIDSCLKILMIQLVRNYPLNESTLDSKHHDLITKILKEIDRNYSTISLEEIATKYGYNKNYLGNVFKEETGKTFTQIVTQQRLIKAYGLITSTNLSINEIMEQIGITNKTFFYKKYKELYHSRPGDDR